MPTSTRRLATSLLLAAVVLPVGPARAEDGTVVMTAPYAADGTSTSCAAVGACLAEAEASRGTGDLSVDVSALGGYVLNNGGREAVASADITAAHEVSAGVRAIGYRIVLDVNPAVLAAPPGMGSVNVTAHTSHSGGLPLAGGVVNRTPFVGGVIVHDGEDANMVIEMEVRPEGSAEFTAGTMNVKISLAGGVVPFQVDGATGVLAGQVESAFNLLRVEATPVLA